MEQKEWDDIKTIDVPSAPNAIWTLALDYVPANTVLRLTATGTWHYAPNATCGPDGDRNPQVTRAAMTGIAPIGAVIGRIGGSMASVPKADDTGVFAVGSFAVITAQSAGPLFLTINLSPSQFLPAPENMKVTISEFAP